MAANDSAARHVVDVAHSLGLRVPEQVAVIGVDNDELLCEASPVPLSSVAVDAVRIGFEAARMLDAWLAGQRPQLTQPLLIPPLGVVTRQSSDASAIEDALVAQAVAWLQNHLRQPINIERLLDDLPVSRRQLELRFRLALGRTPAAELRRLRIERIKTLIDSTDLPFARIADEVGLASPAVLSQIFSREVGLTPSQYRQRARLPE